MKSTLPSFPNKSDLEFWKDRQKLPAWAVKVVNDRKKQFYFFRQDLERKAATEIHTVINSHAGIKGNEHDKRYAKNNTLILIKSLILRTKKEGLGRDEFFERLEDLTNGYSCYKDERDAFVKRILRNLGKPELQRIHSKNFLLKTKGIKNY